jgi:hypothetical protein
VRRSSDGGERSSVAAIGVDWREGEEWRARCGEVEAGAHFVGTGGGGEVVRRPAAVEF